MGVWGYIVAFKVGLVAGLLLARWLLNRGARWKGPPPGTYYGPG